jgi:ribose-phosphate pyrophosphokinase
MRPRCRNIYTNVDRYKEHIPILVDDIISTGRTMIETITHLKNAGMKLFTLIVHAITLKMLIRNKKFWC